MNKLKLEKILLTATEICAQAGTRLTDKRKQVLAHLLQAKLPQSAYELTETYNAQTHHTMPAMSVYRILDFLETMDLVHKLASANKYVACSHINCCDSHTLQQFVICNQCHTVKEILIPQDVIDQLKQQVSKAKYQLTNAPLELNCICEKCLKNN